MNNTNFDTSILQDFRLFNPMEDDLKSLPDMPGNYIIVLKHDVELPSIINVKPIFKYLDSYPILYTGIASKSLRNRDYKQHFTGNAGSSTLRKSLGCLMGFRQIPRDKNPESKKTKFENEDESKLSEWMSNNLILFYLPGQSDYDKLETALIDILNPPLNI